MHFCHTKPMRYTERGSMRLEKNAASRMDGALREGETRADFIRDAIAAEVERRQSTFFLLPIDVRMHATMLRVHDYLIAERAAGREPTTDDAGIKKMLHVAEGRK